MSENQNNKRTFRDNIYLQLFWSFFKIGIFTIGGGMAMIPLIQDVVVDKKKWMTSEECVDCIAVSQGLPGVIAINMATYIGNFKKGIKGAIASTIGVITPSYIIIILICELLHGVGDNPYVLGALTGIKAAATGLILYAAYSVGRKVVKNWFHWILAISAFVAIAVFNVNAVYVIIAGILIGIIHGGEKR